MFVASDLTSLQDKKTVDKISFQRLVAMTTTQENKNIASLNIKAGQKCYQRIFQQNVVAPSNSVDCIQDQEVK